MKYIIVTAILISALGASVVSAASISVDIPNIGCPIGGTCPTAAEAAGGISLNIIRIYQFAVAIAGILAVGMIVAGSVYYSASAGSPDRQSEGKDMITSAVWGIVLLFGSYLILNTINPRLTALEEPYAPVAVPCKYDAQGKIVEQYDAQGNLLPCLPPKFSYTDILIPGDTEAVSVDASSIIPVNARTRANLSYCDGISPPIRDMKRYAECMIRSDRTNLEPISNEIDMKAGQCRWGGEPSDCKVNPKTNAALLALIPKFDSENIFLTVTEAFPPTVYHKSQEHYNGCAVDVRVGTTGGFKKYCETIVIAIKKAEESGFRVTNEYKSCGGKEYETTIGGHLHLAAKNCP